MSFMDDVVRLLQRSNCIKLGRFVLSSGNESRIYIDLRALLSHPKEFKSLIKLCDEAVDKMDFDILAGVESSGIPLATILALEREKPMIYVRKEVKDHGLRKRIEGDVRPGVKALVIDDVATTGASLERAVRTLRSEGLMVSDAFVVIDREEGAGDKLAELGVKLSSLVTLSQITSRLKKLEEEPEGG